MHETTQDPMTQDAVLAPYLRAATGPQASLGDDFLARLVADADAMQPPLPVVAQPQPRVTWAARAAGFWSALGGTPAFTACALAIVAGFWIGLAPPAVLADAMPLWPDSDVGIGFYDEGEILALLEEE